MSSNESSVQAALQVFPVLPAGDNGERSWPLHRRSKLNQFLTLDDSRLSLIRVNGSYLTTLSDMTGSATLVVREIDQRLQICERLPCLSPENLRVKPVALDIMAVLYAALQSAQMDSHRLMGDFYSDHLVDRPEVFIRVVCQAAPWAMEQDVRVTIGLEDIYQSFTYRYIEYREQIGLDVIFHVHQAVHFTEKLGADYACEFLNTGSYRWSSGMLVWKAQTVLGWEGNVLLIPAKVVWNKLTATSDLEAVVVCTAKITLVIHDEHPQKLVRQLKADPNLERYV